MAKKREDIEIGKRIKAIRATLNMNQRDFANKIKSTVSALSNWENGRNKPNDIMLNRISKLGNTTIEYILYGDPEIRVKNILMKKYGTSDRLIPFVLNSLKNKNQLYPNEKEIFEEYEYVSAVIDNSIKQNLAKITLALNIRLAKNDLFEFIEKFQKNLDIDVKNLEQAFNDLKEAENSYEIFFEKTIDEVYEEHINELNEN